MKHVLLSCLLLTAGFSLWAQTYTRSWRNCTDNLKNAPRQPVQASLTDSAGNLYTAGYAGLSTDPYNDSIYLRKYDTNGKLLWQAAEPFKASTVWTTSLPMALTLDASGNAVLCYSYSFINSNVDAVVVKYNPAGTRLWQTVFDGPVDVDNEQARSLVTDNKGNIYLMVAENYNYATAVKLNAKGKILWYRDMFGIVVDGTYTDFQTGSATIDSTGNMYITGYTARLHNGNYHDILTYKFFSNGDSAWRNRFGYSYSDHFGFKILYSKSDNSIVVGGRVDYQNHDSAIVVKYAAGGKQLWSYVKQPKDMQFIDLSAAAIDADNNVVLAVSGYGVYYPAPDLIKLSPGGSMLLEKSIFTPPASSQGLPYTVADMRTDAKNQYYLVSYVSKSLLIEKLSSAGNVLAQTQDSTTPASPVAYASLNIDRKEAIYLAAGYQVVYNQTRSCLSKYSLKGKAADESLVGTNEMLKTVSNPSGTIYPNPARDVIYLPAVAIGSAYTLAVYDATGKPVMTQRKAALQSAVSVAALARGVYVVKVTGNTITYTYKLVKE